MQLPRGIDNDSQAEESTYHMSDRPDGVDAQQSVDPPQEELFERDHTEPGDGRHR